MHLTDKGHGNGGERLTICHAQSVNENRSDLHPLQHASDLKAAAVNNDSFSGGDLLYFLNGSCGIFQQRPADFDDDAHGSKPAVGSHSSIRFRF